MSKRFVRSMLIALVLGVCANGTVTAERPWALLCELPDRSSHKIPIDAFGGMSGAVHQCLFFWHGKPYGVER